MIIKITVITVTSAISVITVVIMEIIKNEIIIISANLVIKIKRIIVKEPIIKATN